MSCCPGETGALAIHRCYLANEVNETWLVLGVPFYPIGQLGVPLTYLIGPQTIETDSKINLKMLPPQTVITLFLGLSEVFQILVFTNGDYISSWWLVTSSMEVAANSLSLA